MSDYLLVSVLLYGEGARDSPPREIPVGINSSITLSPPGNKKAAKKSIISETSWQPPTIRSVTICREGGSETHLYLPPYRTYIISLSRHPPANRLTNDSDSHRRTGSSFYHAFARRDFVDPILSVPVSAPD